MTKEEQNLLLKDLCARLPYGVKVCYITLSDEMPKVWDLIGMPASHLADIIVDGKYRFAACDIEENIRPYLRPMSSMTEEENDEKDNLSDETEIFDWLLKNHFDYRGLIPKGLALEAPKDMYNI